MLLKNLEHTIQHGLLAAGKELLIKEDGKQNFMEVMALEDLLLVMVDSMLNIQTMEEL